ncbi:SDR family NAD(P)-dependent oxidoreductase [Halobacteriales archaeon Cl-PHB]
MDGLDDKTVIVTGSGRGIGNAIATRLAREGATVAINDLEAEVAESAVADLEAEGYDALAAPADVTDREAAQAMVDDVIAEAGQLDVLVNNAGWVYTDFFKNVDPDTWDDMIALNYVAHLNTTRAVIDHMEERESGTIIGISSDAGRVGTMGQAVYAGAKAGVIGFMKSMARELAHYDVTCNVVAPGPTDTPLVEEAKEQNEFSRKVHESMGDQVPLGRMAEPEDVAGAVAFFASDDADFITGQVLSVNGGLAMAD